MTDLQAKWDAHRAMRGIVQDKYGAAQRRDILSQTVIAIPVLLMGAVAAASVNLGHDVKPALLAVFGGLALGLAALFFFRGSSAYKNHVNLAWAGLFSDWALHTPSGERGRCIGADMSGWKLRLRFDNGTEGDWHLSLLQDEAGNPFVPGADTFHEGDAGALRRLSKVRWKSPEGKVGDVRQVTTPLEGDTELTLGFSDGSLERHKIIRLEPVPR